MQSRFDPSHHHLVEQRYFDDFAVGEVFRAPSRTMTDAYFQVFQAASADNHPLHYDRHYCQRRGHRDLVAHGFQVLIQTCPGATILVHQIDNAIVAFLEQSSRFLAPVYAGDTVYPTLTISALTPQRTTGVMELKATVHNQHGCLVLDGEHKLLVRRRRPEMTPSPDSTM
ncbi:MAG: MaoC family dehydratase [Hyphomicrobiaceae bacterium]